MPKSPAKPSSDAAGPSSPFAGTPDLAVLRQRARKASNFLKALSNENRLMLLCLISDRERSVTELETILALRQPTVSQQLARLRNDGLVAPRREGKVIYYRLASDEVRRTINLGYELFCRDLMGPPRKTAR
ncbi:MAG TPA: metalloregulator ArsR/SmtB family transcription factor [Hyphomicrobiales bacterium]|jgi:DNA-binding transcriptional ArsR family regulator